MKLMLTVAFEFLDNKEQATFKQIFDEVKKELKTHWKKSFPTLTADQIDVKKKGELFTYLSTDGRFVMTDNTHWGLVQNFSFDDIKKMRVNVGENNEN